MKTFVFIYVVRCLSTLNRNKHSCVQHNKYYYTYNIVIQYKKTCYLHTDIFHCIH